MSNFDVDWRYLAAERAGVRILPMESRMELCNLILLILVHWKVWSPNKSMVQPQGHT